MNLFHQHIKEIIRVDASFDKNSYGEAILCKLEKGGVMLMKPLLLHVLNKELS